MIIKLLIIILILILTIIIIKCSIDRIHSFFSSVLTFLASS